MVLAKLTIDIGMVCGYAVHLTASSIIILGAHGGIRDQYRESIQFYFPSDSVWHDMG